jgi:hypothetical protein
VATEAFAGLIANVGGAPEAGKGFGVNLALDDGFHGASDDGPPLRSPPPPLPRPLARQLGAHRPLNKHKRKHTQT